MTTTIKTGDIVRIDGLQSEKGARMNGQLAECHSSSAATGERVNVVLTLPQGKIATASLRRENLTIILTAAAAEVQCEQSKQAYEVWEQGINWDDLKNEMHRVNQDVLSRVMKGIEILQGIRDNQVSFALDLSMPGRVESLSRNCVEEMFANGLIEICLDKFAFPASIDLQRDPLYFQTVHFRLGFVSTMLGRLFDENDRTACNQWNNALVGQLGPVLMTLCTPKRRFANLSRAWKNLQGEFIRLLCNCLHTGGQERIQLFLDTMPKVVLDALARHLVLLLSVDASFFEEAAHGPEHLKDFYGQIKRMALVILAELTSVEYFGPDFATCVGKLTVPNMDGVTNGLQGRRFVECFPDVASTFPRAVQHLPDYKSGEVLFDLRFVYQNFFDCSQLRPLFGFVNREFFALQSNSDFENWAQSRLGNNGGP